MLMRSPYRVPLLFCVRHNVISYPSHLLCIRTQRKMVRLQKHFFSFLFGHCQVELINRSNILSCGSLHRHLILMMAHSSIATVSVIRNYLLMMDLIDKTSRQCVFDWFVSFLNAERLYSNSLFWIMLVWGYCKTDLWFTVVNWPINTVMLD